MVKKKIIHSALISFFISGYCLADDSQGMEKFLTNKPSSLKPFYHSLYTEGERNAVLNFNMLGLAAMETGEFQVAEKAFDEAIKRIDSIYANDENAQKAKSIWNEEKVKDWKGEPYERAMTYFYRGLLYARVGDYDNAAASFRAADYQDTQAEQESYQGDFGLMPYMAAWAQTCRGNKVQANDLLAQAKTRDTKFASTFSALPVTNNFIMVIDSGIGPYKEGTGQFKELLEIKDSLNSQDTLVKVEPVQGEKILVSDTLQAGDVFFQASTRGGRQVDGILNGKAKWKEGTNTVGEVATTIGSAAMMAGSMSNDSNTAGFGALASLLGMMVQAAAESMNPAADTRHWGSLPRNISLATGVTAKVPTPPVKETVIDVSKSTSKPKSTIATPGQKAGKSVDAPNNVVIVADEPKTLPKLMLRYHDGTKETTKPITFVATNAACGIAWARTRSAMPRASGGLANLSANSTDDDGGRAEKNLAFRAMLPDTF